MGSNDHEYIEDLRIKESNDHESIKDLSTKESSDHELIEDLSIKKSNGHEPIEDSSKHEHPENPIARKMRIFELQRKMKRTTGFAASVDAGIISGFETMGVKWNEEDLSSRILWSKDDFECDYDESPTLICIGDDLSKLDSKSKSKVTNEPKKPIETKAMNKKSNKKGRNLFREALEDDRLLCMDNTLRQLKSRMKNKSASDQELKICKTKRIYNISEKAEASINQKWKLELDRLKGIKNIEPFMNVENRVEETKNPQVSSEVNSPITKTKTRNPKRNRNKYNKAKAQTKENNKREAKVVVDNRDDAKQKTLILTENKLQTKLDTFTRREPIEIERGIEETCSFLPLEDPKGFNRQLRYLYVPPTRTDGKSVLKYTRNDARAILDYLRFTFQEVKDEDIRFIQLV